MADSDTLLVSLSTWFTSRTEDIVTEALGYILRSATPREALDDVVRSGVLGVAPVARVVTQKQNFGDGTRPDLSGMDEEGTERVLIEAKFRAVLTSRQPNDYLDRLPEKGTSVLMFVVPEDRIARLWPELRRRAEHEGKKLYDIDGERKCVRVDDTNRHLMVVSWTGLLDTIAAKTREAGESSVESDIRQLKSLVQYGEDRTFAPIRESGEDFGPDSQRLGELKQLIDMATDRGVAQEWASKRGLNRTPKPYGYGRYVRLQGREVWFGINTTLFEKTSETPLWVNCYSITSEKSEKLRIELGMPDPRWAPVELKRDAEFPEVLDGVVESLKRIADAIKSVNSES